MGVSVPRTIQSPVGAEIVIDGVRYVNFGGSSYLGLSGSTDIVEAGMVALRASGSGYQFARHYQIATRAHQDAESEAAAFFGSEAALYLPSGYYFGFVAMAALRQHYHAVFLDELSHHSLREGAAVSGLPSYEFRHLDSDDLGAKLKRHLRAHEMPLVLTDGMYSTFGEIAPLREFASILAPYGGRLVVDESHSFGVLGDNGRGVSEHHDLHAPSILIGGSTGKAFGVIGGIIPGSEAEIAELRMSPAARSSSVGLPASAAMCAMSFRYVRRHPELLQRLRANVAHMKKGLRKIGVDVADTVAPVATFTTRSGESMQTLQARLMSEGIYVLHSNYIGAAPAGVIRCGIFADHTDEHIERLIDALRRLL